MPSTFPLLPNTVTRTLSFFLRANDTEARYALERTNATFQEGCLRVVEFLKRELDDNTQFWQLASSLGASSFGTALAPYFIAKAKTPTAGVQTADAEAAALAHPDLPFQGWANMPRAFVVGMLREAIAKVKAWKASDDLTRQAYAELQAKCGRLKEAIGDEAEAFTTMADSFEASKRSPWFSFNRRFGKWFLGDKTRTNRHDEEAADALRLVAPRSAAGGEKTISRLMAFAECRRKLTYRRQTAQWPNFAGTFRVPFSGNHLHFALTGGVLGRMRLQLLNRDRTLGHYEFTAKRAGQLGRRHTLTPKKLETVARAERTLIAKSYVDVKDPNNPPVGSSYEFEFERGRHAYRGTFSELALSGKKVYIAYHASAAVDKTTFEDTRHVNDVVLRHLSASSKNVGRDIPKSCRVMSVDLGWRPAASWAVTEGGDPTAVVAFGDIGRHFVDDERGRRVEALADAVTAFYAVRSVANGNDDRLDEALAAGFAMANPEADLRLASAKVRELLDKCRHMRNDLGRGIGLEAPLFAKAFQDALSCTRSSYYRRYPPAKPGEARTYMSSYRESLGKYQNNYRNTLASALVSVAIDHGVHIMVPEDLSNFMVNKGRGRFDNKMLALWAKASFLDSLTHTANCHGITVAPIAADMTSLIDHVTGEFGFRSKRDKGLFVAKRAGRHLVLDSDFNAAMNLQHNFLTRFSRADTRLFGLPLADGCYVAAPRPVEEDEDDSEKQAAKFPLAARADAVVFTKYGTHYPLFEPTGRGLVLKSLTKKEHTRLVTTATDKGTYLYLHDGRYYPKIEHERLVENIGREAARLGLIEDEFEQEEVTVVMPKKRSRERGRVSALKMAS